MGAVQEKSRARPRCAAWAGLLWPAWPREARYFLAAPPPSSRPGGGGADLALSKSGPPPPCARSTRAARHGAPAIGFLIDKKNIKAHQSHAKPTWFVEFRHFWRIVSPGSTRPGRPVALAGLVELKSDFVGFLNA